MNNYAAQRAAKDDYFRQSSHSPLTQDQQKSFKQLPYFAPTEALVVTATIERFENPDSIKMQSSTGKLIDYMRWGKATFFVGTEEVSLVLYYSGNGLFLPFRDATSGSSTYGAGRYLDLEIPAGDELILDFNLAYNPYCAYNERWTCPVPPFENWLTVAIEAGEKSFEK